jgi:spore photoproduct lyase
LNFSSVYIEDEIAETERVTDILARVGDIPRIRIERYGEIFNRAGQNFRLQKQAPALILAKKHGKKVLPAPEGYGFEQGSGFYFSHMLNCLYDCRYCFLQGMYRSAHYILFTNYEDFMHDILGQSAQAAGNVFYSGYDCDSLAMEPVSGFCNSFIPFFANRPEMTLEIRTKSTQVRKLLEFDPLPNCVVAMSFTPEAAAKRWEHRVPAITKRLQAMRKLQQAGWPVAIRFEPVIAEPEVENNYARLFQQVFSTLNGELLHSVSLGEFRLPTDFHKKMVKLYPEEGLLARETICSDGMVSLAGGGAEMMQAIESRLLTHVDSSRYYRCG